MEFKRPDGRLPNELREIIISFDGLDGVDGSARFGFGETKALASVSGPIEVRLAVEQASRATFEVIVRPLSGLPGTDSKATASAVRNALQKSLILTNNPRTLVQLVALALSPAPSLQSSGGPPTNPNFEPNLKPRYKSKAFSRTGPSLVAALINASTLALLNASSIPLLGVVCAVSVGRVSSASASTDTSELVLDPSDKELSELDGAAVFAFLITADRDDPVHSSSSSSSSFSSSAATAERGLKATCAWFDCSAVSFDEEELVRAMTLARAGALRVRERMKEAIEQHAFRAGSRSPASASVSASVSASDAKKLKIRKEKQEQEDANTTTTTTTLPPQPVYDDEKMEIS